MSACGVRGRGLSVRCFFSLALKFQSTITRGIFLSHPDVDTLDHDDPHLDGDEEVRGDESARSKAKVEKHDGPHHSQRKTWGGAVKDAER